MKFLCLVLFALSLLATASPASGQVKIGVALPLMKGSPESPDKSVGENMLKGINDALSEYKNKAEVIEVGILIEDTGKDPEKTIEVLNKFGSEKSVISVLGPVFSIELSNSAGAADFHKMPVVSPTATLNFVAEKNPYVFQLNPTYEVRGRLMAKYAVEKLGMKKFIVLSEDSYGKFYSEGFMDHLKSISDSVKFAAYYNKDQYDLSSQAAEIRNYLEQNDKFIDFGSISVNDLEKLRELGLRKEMSDTLIMKRYLVSVHKLPGGITPEALSSSGVTVSDYNEKSFNIIFGAADAIYIPIARHDEISKIALALFKNRINLPILGTSDWNNAESLYGSSNILPKIFFEADFFLTSEQRSEVMNMKEQDMRNYFFGLGAMRLLLSEISKGNTTRSEMNEALEKVKDFEAPCNNITLINRTNHSLRIMRFKEGDLKKIEDYEY